MLVSFSMIPLDKGAHFSPYVAKLMKIVEDSGLPHQLTAMSTLIEGDWDEVMDVINKCRLELIRDSERISVKIWIDEKVGVTGMLTRKIQSVEEKMRE